MSYYTPYFKHVQTNPAAIMPLLLTSQVAAGEFKTTDKTYVIQQGFWPFGDSSNESRKYGEI